MKKLLVAIIVAGGALWAAPPAEGHGRVSVRVSYGYPHYYPYASYGYYPAYGYHYRYPVYSYGHRFPAYKRFYRPHYGKGYFAPHHRFHKRYAAYGRY